MKMGERNRINVRAFYLNICSWNFFYFNIFMKVNNINFHIIINTKSKDDVESR